MGVVKPRPFNWPWCTPFSNFLDPPLSCGCYLFCSHRLSCSHCLSCSHLSTFNSTPSACRYLITILRYEHALNAEVLKAGSVHTLNRKYMLNNAMHLTTRVTAHADITHTAYTNIHRSNDEDNRTDEERRKGLRDQQWYFSIHHIRCYSHTSTSKTYKYVDTGPSTTTSTKQFFAV